MNDTKHTWHFTEKGGMSEPAIVALSVLRGILSSPFPPFFPQIPSIQPNTAYAKKKKMRIRKGSALEKHIY